MQEDLQNRKRQWIGFGAATLVLLAAFLYAFYLRQDIGMISFQDGPCGFSRRFHLYCPGCGGTHAVKAILRGDVIGSVLSNPIPVYTAILVMRIWIALFHNTVWMHFRKKESKMWRVMYQWEMWGILVVVVGFFVLRDLALVLLHWDYLGYMVQYW